MAQRLGLEHLPTGLTRLWRSILQIETPSCSLFFRFQTALRTAGNCSLVSIKFNPADDTIFRRVFFLLVPIPPGSAAFLGTSLCLPICLKGLFTDDTGLRRNGSVLQLLLLILVQSATSLSAGQLMRSNWDILQFTNNTDPRRIPFLLTQSFFSS